MSQNSSPAELREIGLKVTAPRIKVLEFFQQNPSSHYSAEEVYMALSKDDSDIALQSSTFNLIMFGQYSDTVLGNKTVEIHKNVKI